MKSRQTDSSHLEAKVQIRIASLSKDGKIRILNLFSGANVIWNTVISRTMRDIEVTNIDTKDIHGSIKADNRKVIPGLDLSIFQVIDCDSYGDPYEQLCLLFSNPTLAIGMIIHFTFIRISLSHSRYGILDHIGISRTMASKMPSLFSRLEYQSFIEFLRKNGVEKVFEITIEHEKYNRHGAYGYFIVAKGHDSCHTISAPTEQRRP